MAQLGKISDPRYDTFIMKKLYAESFLAPVIIAGLFFIPFLPLVVSGSLFFPYITGKAFVFRLIVEIIAMAWLVLALQSPKYRPQRSGIILAALAFVASLVLATIFSDNPYRSFWSNFERMEGLVTHLHIFFYFLVMTSVLKVEDLWRRLFLTNLFASLLVGGYGLLQLAGALPIMQGGVRLDSTLGNAAYLGTYMFFSFFITLYLLLGEWRDKSWRYFYLLTMLLQVVILYQTATRGAIIGFVGGLFLTALLGVWHWRGNTKVRNWSGAVVVVLLLVAGGTWLMRDSALITSSPVLSRFASISLADQTVKARFLVWNIAWQGVKEKPILGWGQDNFQFVFSKYYDPRMYAQEPWFDRSHNVFLDWLVAAGFIGLLTYLFLFASAIWAVARNKNEIFTSAERVVLVGLLVGYFFQNLVIFDNLTSYTLFFTLIGYIHFRQSQNSRAVIRYELSPEKIRRFGPLLGAGAVVLLGAVSFFVVVRPVLASGALIEALRQSNAGNIKVAADSFQQVFNYHTFASKEGSEQAATALSGAIYYRRASLQDLNHLATVAENGLKNQLANAPQDVRLLIFYADLLQITGRPKEALAQLELAKTYAPGKQDIYNRLAFYAIESGDKEAALSYAKQSFDLLPENDTARKAYGLIALRTGNRALAEKILLPKFGTMAVDDDSFINYYSSQKRYDLVAQIWEQRLKDSPTSGEIASKYAMAVYATGNTARAIAILEKAKTADPSFASEATKLIEAIRKGAVQVN